MTKEQTIQHYMAKLGLTQEEAEQLWLDEQNDNLPTLTQKQKQVEKEMRQADRKKETTPRKRERKADEDKRFLVTLLSAALDGQVENISIENPEREVSFEFKNQKYHLTLIRRRKEKEK